MLCLLNGWRTVALILAVCATAGCSRFTYSPSYIADFPAAANRTGLAIQTGRDLRPADRITPDWCESAEPIVARALADEVRHANLYDRVKLHPRTVKPQKYPTIVQCDVLQFDCVNKATQLEQTGRSILRMTGPQGFFIAAGIPSEFTSEIEVRFEVMDPVTGRPKFTKNYRAQRTGNFNRYQGKKPLMRQTSVALEEVVAQFVHDLASLPRD